MALAGALTLSCGFAEQDLAEWQVLLEETVGSWPSTTRTAAPCSRHSDPVVEGK